MEFTKEQLKAIELDKNNILVCAAAGSGKTTVLCNRIAQRVIKGECDISKILVVTFTIASADDLKRKLRNTLNKAYASVSDIQTKRYIQKQLTILPKAKISTIHSFALDIIRQNFEKLGLPAKVRVADEWESKIIAERIMNKTIEEMYKNDSDGSFVELTDILITDRDGELSKYFLEVYRILSNEIKGIDFILDNIEKINKEKEKEFFETPWGLFLKNDAAEKLDYCVKYLKEASDSYSEDSPAYKFYGTKFKSIYESAKNLRDSLDCGLESFKNCLLGTKLPSFQGNPGAKAKEAQVDNYPYYKEIFEFFKSITSTDGKKLGFQFDVNSLNNDMVKTAQYLKTLYSVLSLFDKMFGEEKKKRGVVDFTDIERMAHSLLIDRDGNKTDLAVKYTSEFSELYIDEYQDTNKIQDDIFRAIADSNRFIVGDIKQSIYGFRGACPDLFSGYRQNGFENGSGQRIFLSENFRSDNNIIDFSNDIFSSIMRDVKTVGYTKEDNLKFSKKEKIKDEKTELYLFRDIKGQDNCTQGEFVASYIKKLLDEGVSPDDVAVLSRSNTDSAIVDLIDGCEKFGVPMSVGCGEEFFKKPWILLLICLINTIDNKTKDIYVTGALKGELFSFTLDMLAKVRTEFYSDMGMWYSLEKYVNDREEKNSIDNIALLGRKFFNYIEKMRQIEKNSSVDELIRTVIYSSKIIEAMSRGKSKEETEEIRIDIMRIYSFAVDFASRSSMGLSSFIAHLNGIMEKEASGNKKERSGMVKLMTIHGSKGLQYPVCILYNATKSFKLAPDKDCPIMFGGELGFAFRLKGERVEDKHDTGLTGAIKQKYAKEQREEEMRLLYVAFTRAENRLVITGKTTLDFGDPSPFDIEAARVMSASNYLEWVHICLNVIGKDTYTFEVNPTICTQPGLLDKESSIGEVCKMSQEDLERIKNVGKDYSYSAELSIPAKASVSDLSPSFLDIQDGKDENESNAKEKRVILPSFVSGAIENIQAKKGTATHLFMQFCDFDKCLEFGVDCEINRLLKMGFIDEETAMLISREKVNCFFKSSLYGMIKRGGKILREQRFNIKLSADLFTLNAEKKKLLKDREMLVQGVIDCVFFDENGELVLVDYKTDSFGSNLSSEEIIKELKKRYTNQLSYYLLALEQIFPNVKKRAVIYSFFLGNHFDID